MALSWTFVLSLLRHLFLSLLRLVGIVTPLRRSQINSLILSSDFVGVRGLVLVFAFSSFRFLADRFFSATDEFLTLDVLAACSGVWCLAVLVCVILSAVRVATPSNSATFFCEVVVITRGNGLAAARFLAFYRLLLMSSVVEPISCERASGAYQYSLAACGVSAVLVDARVFFPSSCSITEPDRLLMVSLSSLCLVVAYTW